MAGCGCAQIFISFALVSTAFAGSAVIKPDEYELEWFVQNGEITVTASVRTLGYVGFGISPNGGMTGADLILAGRNSDGTGYAIDAYGIANANPQIDASQDVVLVSALENATHTTVTFTRKLDTGDSAQDIPIINDNQNVIWSWGPTDNIQYHGPNRGTLSLYLGP